MPTRRGHRPAPTDSHLGLVLVDYDNLFQALESHSSKGEQPHRFLIAMLSELRRYLQDEMGIRAARSIAFGDFTCHEIDAGLIMNDLAANGVEPRHVQASKDRTDAEVSLTIHATELLHARRDLGAFVVLSGDHWYMPLVQHLQTYGKFVFVAALDLPPNLTALQSGVSDSYLNARFLLDSRSRDTLKEARSAEKAGQEDSVEAAAESAQSRAPKDTSIVEDPGAIHALEIIEEFFGQYEEVYLTPLLRKLTESLDPEDGEPKDAVSLLQDAGAVWLEKRRGFPYDYTVLLVNAEHPDVKRVREAFAEYSADSAEADYDDDEYDDDADDADDADAFEDEYDEGAEEPAR